MEDLNKHIEDFLLEYSMSTSVPYYGILLDGPWGSGKTWYIKKIQKIFDRNKIKYLYVSLFGLVTCSDIEGEFYRQLNPKLGSTGMKNTGLLLRDIIKNNTGGDVSFLYNIKKAISKSKDRILFFDDIERTKIPITELLGYINHLIEHAEFKVILITNESEIEELKEYSRVKEKIIGRTFQIEPDYNGAIDQFIEDLGGSIDKNILIDNKSMIKNIFIYSGYSNLRVTKNVIWDSLRFLNNISSAIKNKKEAISHLLGIFYIYSFEIQLGKITVDEIYNLNLGLFMLGEKERSVNKYTKLLDKYIDMNSYDGLLSDDLWKEIFTRGSIPGESIKTEIYSSQYFIDENTPNWKKLWHFSHLTDDEFIEVYESVKIKYDKREYKDIFIVLHIYGVILKLSQLKIVDEPKLLLYRDAIEYIDSLFKNDWISPIQTNYKKIFAENNMYGLAFMSFEEKEFRDAIHYLYDKNKQEIVKDYADLAKSVISMLKSDTPRFLEMLSDSSYSQGLFITAPILSYVDIDEFSDCITRLNPKAILATGEALSLRYQDSYYAEHLTDELEWLSSLRDALCEKLSLLDGPITKYCLSQIIKHNITNSIQYLQKNSKE